MFPTVATNDAAAVKAEVESIYLGIYPEGDSALVGRVFECVLKCFRGECTGYLAIDTRYHDLEHTLQGALCMARLLAARQKAQAKPLLDQSHFELGLLAILLHDTGYAKQENDTSGTGAKYTHTHVERSAKLAAKLLNQKGFAPREIRAVQNMIRCTGVNADLGAIPFESDVERIVGCALATADLLGQMAASDYIEKLPFLHAEFAEAAEFSGRHRFHGAAFLNADELLRNTPSFWRSYVRPRLDGDFGGLYRFLADPYPDGPNDYIDRIESNIRLIEFRLGKA